MNARTASSSTFTYKSREVARMQSIRKERSNEGEAPAKVRKRKQIIRMANFINFLPKNKDEKKWAKPPIIAKCIPESAKI